MLLDLEGNDLREAMEVQLLDILIACLAERQRGPAHDEETLQALNACTLAYNRLNQRANRLGR